MWDGEKIHTGTKLRAFSWEPTGTAALQTPTYVQADISMPAGCYGQPKISKLQSPNTLYTAVTLGISVTKSSMLESQEYCHHFATEDAEDPITVR